MKHHQKILILGAIVALLSAVILQAPFARAADKVIKVGATLPLTGPAATWGLAGLHGVELGADDINAAGGVVIKGVRYKFEVIGLDDKYSVDKAVENANQLIYQEKVKYMYTQSSAANLAMAGLLTRNKVILMHQSYDDRTIDPKYPYSFRLVIPGTTKGPSFFGWIVKNHHIKTSSHIAPDDTTGWAQAKMDNDNLKKLGAEILDDIFFDRATTDFVPFVTKMLAKKPDMITCGGAPVGSLALIMKQARAMGYKGLITNISPTSAKDIVPVAGPEAVEGLVTTSIALEAPMVSQKMIELPKREEAKYGVAYGSTWDLYVYMPPLAAAMERAQSTDTDAIKRIWEDTSQEWPYYPFPNTVLKFGTPRCIELYGEAGKHQAYYPYMITKIQNGKDVNIALVNP